MRYSNDKDINRYVKQYVLKGWTFSKQGKHGKLVSPDGKAVIISGTPSSPYSLKITRKNINKLLKEI